MSHTCPQCHQKLIPVHPLEVKAAINYLHFLVNDPRAKYKGRMPYHNFVLEGDRKWMLLARYAAETIPEESYKLWHGARETEEYARLRSIELNKAAEKLIEGWLPVGYILDEITEPEKDCAYGTGKGCTHDREKGDFYCYKAWL